MDLQNAVHTLEEVSRDDLEACEKAIRAGEQDAAIRAIERAFAKIDGVIDLLRSQPGC